MKFGREMYKLAEELWPIGRSLSGSGVRKTLGILNRELPELQIGAFYSGESAFDWNIPQEWNVESATLTAPDGRIICDYQANNLSLVGYSIPTTGSFTLDQLQEHLYSLESQPTAIPYVTSYYKKDWGFCLSHVEREALQEGLYEVKIQSRLEDGELNFGEALLKGTSDREILFSTYVCHPSMANNELSGPVLAIALANFVKELEPYYSYRFLFLPETIGSIAYLSKNLDSMKKNMLAGFVLTCVGDDGNFSYIPSRKGDSVADKVALENFSNLNIKFERYSWNHRGSDERQYCAPGVDLPVASVTRSKYGEYPEYHTSLDTLGGVVTENGLQGSFTYFTTLIKLIESQRFPIIKTLGEPQLGKRGLYPTTSIKGVYGDTEDLLNVISQLDGTQSIDEISKTAGVSQAKVNEVCDVLERAGILRR